MKKIGIIGAMDEEILTLKKILTPSEGKDEITVTRAGGLDFYEGKIEGVDVIVVRSGIGKVNAALCAQRLIIQFGATHVINTGIAGAVAPGLAILDMVVSTDALEHDFDTTTFGYDPTVIPRMKSSVWEADESMRKAALEAFEANKDKEPFSGHHIVEGRIASGDQFVEDRRMKQHIVEICNPTCVEMEGAAIAHACYLNNTPYLILRCMSDMADDGEIVSYGFNAQTAAVMSSTLMAEVIKRV